MSKLQYLTRGNSSPQGKPRVYFCGHPKEQEFFLKPISQQILELQNCAIWYDAEPETPYNWEELSADLSQMQLFVIPVTERLLNQPNRAMDKEFPFAIKHHIPVLPLMQESGQEEKFQEKFGDLQFLDANAHDSTAIPFEEKLQKFLNSILIGDELAEKVRAAFDAYIFLSYRKKDRREAQKLMRLIHQNEFCRDIAIWYDEFLVPGENFNEAIADALQKSKLFTLVVTPSLLENPNYVMTTEYPMAKTAGKPILPVEMTPTSRPELESFYESMPSCTKGEDAPALTESLTAALREVAIRKNDDAQHNYFIGLAYLAGIDVEVDNHRAEALIRGAAEQGYEPAMEKLVSMYQSGEGVKRDSHKAIEWQKKLVESREKTWEETQTEDTFIELANTWWKLGDFYKELEDIPNWRWVWETKILSLCKTVWEKYQFSSAHQCISISYERMGDILKAEGNLSASRKYYELDLEISKQLAEESPTIEMRRGLSISYERMGEILKAEGDIPASRKYYELVLEISKQLAEESPTIDIRRGLSVSYERMGDILKAEGDIPAARKYYEFDLEISKQLAEESPTIQIRRGLFVSYNKMGNISEAEGDLQAAKKYYGLALEISKQLAEEASTIQSRRDLSVSYGEMGGTCEAEGDISASRKYFELALKISKQLAEESATLKNRWSLSISYERMGDICETEGDIPAARKYYELDLEISKQLAEESPTIENRRGLSVSYERMGNILKAEGDIPAARKYYELKLNMDRQLVEEAPTIKNRRNLSISYDRMGDILKAEGDLQAAKKYYELALEIRKQLAKESSTPGTWDDLALSYYKLGTLDDSAVYWQQKQKALAQLAKLYPSLSNTMQNSDDAHTRIEESIAYLQKALDIWTRLSEQYPSVPIFAQKRDIVRDELKKLQ